MFTSRRAFACVVLAFGLVTGLQLVLAACPFCSAPSLTLSEQVAQSDAVILVKWVSSRKTEDQKPGSTTYQIEQVVRGPKTLLKKGGQITLVRYRTGKKGDLFLLMGTRGTVIEWGSPLEVSQASFKYIAQAPLPKEAPAKRLVYFLNYLEFPDQLVANDAYAEFANAPYKDITLSAKTMSRERVRQWIQDPDTPVTRLGLYGLMLGLCGNPEDAQLMRQKITTPTDEFRLGIDGVMFGYLLLTGDKGLDVIDRMKLETTVVIDENGNKVLDKEGNTKPLPFSETYAAMQALRQFWTYGNGRIDKDRLKQSMRILLDRSELADLVVADLARWKDWSVQDRLMELYGVDEYDIPSIKRSIVRYMLVSVKDIPQGGGTPEPKHVVKGRKHLKTLEKKDPKTVREAKRFFFLR